MEVAFVLYLAKSHRSLAIACQSSIYPHFTIPPPFGPIHYIYLGNHSRLGTAGVIFTYRWDAWSEVGLQVKHLKMQKLIMMNSKSYQGCLKTLTKHVRIPSTPKHRRPTRA